MYSYIYIYLFRHMHMSVPIRVQEIYGHCNTSVTSKAPIPQTKMVSALQIRVPMSSVWGRGEGARECHLIDVQDVLQVLGIRAAQCGQDMHKLLYLPSEHTGCNSGAQSF